MNAGHLAAGLIDAGPASLQMVVREISIELDEARAALESFAEKPESNRGALGRLREHIHLAQGALRLAEVYGGALLAEEMEHVARYVDAGSAENKIDNDALDSLMRAMEQLPAYVDRVASGGRDVPLALLPLLNDMRAVRGSALLSEGALLMLNLESTATAQPLADAAETADVAELAHRERPRFQRALLGWIRGGDVADRLATLAAIAAELEAAATTRPVYQLWWVVGAVVEALQHDGLQPSVSIKRLLGQADRELRRLNEVGEQVYANSPPVELLNNLLFYVARASSNGARVAGVRDSFQLDDVLPLESDVDDARETLSAPSVKLMKTVAAAIREDLTRVKDVLDIFVRKGTGQVDALAPQLDLLRKISDTLGVLGLGALRDRVKSEIESLNAIVDSHSPPDESTLIGIAAALIEVEDGLDSQLVRMIVPEAERPGSAAGEPTDEEFELVQQAVLRECIVNMARIKEAVTQALGAPMEAQGLDQVPQLVRGITAGLLMLGRQRAVDAMERIGRSLTDIVRPDAKGLDAARLDRLAEAIVAIEYFMEMVQAGRPEPGHMLENAEACLDALGPAVPAEEPAEAAAAVYAQEQPSLAGAGDLAGPGQPPVLESLETPTSPAVDPEFVQIFVEEARENISLLQKVFPQWESNPQDADALLEVRRVFHTLKGSGRMVGARRVGEIAWSLESLLNRLISQTIVRSPEIVSVTRETVAVLPTLIDELEQNLPEARDITVIVTRADALSGREAPAESAAEISTITVPESVTASADEAAGEQLADASESAMDPVLHDIYRKETAGHIAIVRDFVERCAQGVAPHPVSDALYRACHTLSGIAKTAAVRQGIKVAEPMEHYVRKLYDSGHGLPKEALRLLLDTVNALESVSDHVNEDTGYFPNHTPLIVGWQSLEKGLDEELAHLAAAAEQTISDLWPAQPEEFPEDSGHIVIEVPAGWDREEATETEALAAAREAPDAWLAEALEESAAGDRDETGTPAAGESAGGQALDESGAAAEQSGEVSEGDIDEWTEPDLEILRVEGLVGPESEADYTLPHKTLSEDLAGGTDEETMILPEEQTARELEALAPPLPEDQLPGTEAEPPLPTGLSPAATQETEPFPPPAPAVSPEFDADIAAIFSEEASELLEQSEGALSNWRRDPADGNQVTELKRLLHTLKGGARMAGIPAMGDLSHELESLLASLESGDLVGDVVPIDLLQSALDELHRMRDAANEGQSIAPATGLVDRIRGIARGEAAALPPTQTPPPGATAALLPAASGAGPTAADQEPLTQALAEVGEVTTTRPTPDLPEIVETKPAAADEGAETPQAAEAGVEAEPDVPAYAPTLPGREPVVPTDRHELARVDAELLDDLLNNAGEVSIFRARIEQQMTSMEFNLAELGRTVTRLREQLRKLEMETEAQILFKHQRDNHERADFDPLELDRYSTIQQLSRALAESTSDVASIEGLLGNLNRETQNLLLHQGRVITEVQNGLMRTRMVPFQRHVQRLGRIVRQSAQEAGKKVELAVEGGSGELDRQVLERMLPPFEHMLRNAVVHGIEMPGQRLAAGKEETGRIRVRLEREGAEVVITVEDDGQGLDVEAIREKARKMELLAPGQELTDEQALQLVLEPGFSTAGRLTQSAGRGVGMDVVATEVKKLGGGLFIESRPEHGARFTIRLPFTLAITQALIVRVHDETYALPVATVEGVARVPRADVLTHLEEEQPTFEYGGELFRFQYLGGFIDSPPALLPETEEAIPVILVRAGEHSTALVADELIGSQEIVVKSLGPQIAGIRGISGATILGDGRIVVILDVGALVRSEWRSRAAGTAVAAPARDERVLALVVDDSITVRRVTQRLLERNGMRVITAKDGVEAMSIVQDHVPDVILLDIEMPRMDGYEVASQVRNDPRLADVPIIMITSRVGDKHRARAIELGVDDYLGKPYQESQLLDAIEPLVLARRRHVV